MSSPLRGILTLLAGVWSLAACVAAEPTAPATTALALTADRPTGAPTSAYVKMLRSHHIEADIPSSGKFILVNIPSYELIALQDGVPVLRSKVVVGRPVSPTPELLSSMQAVQFNPSWTPTPAMIRNEGLRFMPPGPQNPLGRILFDLDNDEAIYLHDTNEKQLFGRTQRALSHGCVRVEQARALAAWALGVPESEIDALAAQGRTLSVPLTENIPVSLVYYTQFPDEQGQVASLADIYANRQAESRR